MEPISALLPFINLLRPTKSPHLLVFLAGTICVYFFPGADAGNTAAFLFHIPIYVILTIAMFLSFFYQPPEITKLLDAQDIPDEPQNTTNLEDIQEVEHQFKFSRAFCLVTGIIALFIFARDFDPDLGLFSFFAYGVIILHIVIFLFYMVLRVLREEGLKRYAVYQIGLITGVVVIAFSLAYTTMGEQLAFDGEPVPMDWSRNNLIFYGVIWFSYVVFWVSLLRHFIQINVVEPE